MHRLKRLINEHEDWLIDRVVHYAHDNDYTRYTSTLREAWRASIVGLSQPLVAALEEIPATGIPPVRRSGPPSPSVSKRPANTAPGASTWGSSWGS